MQSDHHTLAPPCRTIMPPTWGTPDFIALHFAGIINPTQPNVRPMPGPSLSPSESTRVDKWLWAARFFKHRSAATEAVDGGRVKLNGASVKPARAVKVGDRIDITLADANITIVVTAIAERRGSAEIARQLYTETDESVERRAAARATRALSAAPGSSLHGRPTKRDRRQIERLQRG